MWYSCGTQGEVDYGGDHVVSQYYYTAGQNVSDFNPTQRLHVLESAGTDPMGPYTFRADLGNDWQLDASVLQVNGSLFLMGTYISPDGTEDWIVYQEAGLRGAEDAQVAAVARAEGRTVVTENVVDFTAERDAVLVFVLKKNLPEGGGQAAALAELLDRWAQANPDPYVGPHWPKAAEV